MKIPYYHVDAFAGRVFAGNPAGVCVLEQWLDDERMQAIAAENNLSETAFVVAEGGQWKIRWFTPVMEVDLCGHATLAAGFVVLNVLDGQESVTFDSKSGPLTVCSDRELLSMDFPRRPATACIAPDGLIRALGVEPVAVLMSRDYMVVVESREQVEALSPDMEVLAGLDRLGVIVTAPGDDVDFVSRFFAPAAGIPEDPVTGSAHCTLAPYWAARLGRKKLHALQLSLRGGELFCEDLDERVRIAGTAVLYMDGAIEV